MVEVRKATAADIPEVAEALTRSFADDPVMSFVIPARNHQQRLRRFFATELRHMALPLGEVYTTVGPVMGAAMWAPPGKWRPKPSVLLRSGPSFIAAIGARLPAAMRFMTLVERKHPTEPHYYLSTLGTEPDFQRKGVGSALLQPVLDRCDTEGVPAFLESSKEANVPYYRRHGFDVTEQVSVAGGPPIWLMWREPQLSTTR
jgi:predicted N-acetyltransferase YhbS